MYYIIYDRDYPMTAFMSHADIVGMAEDVLFPRTLKEEGFAPYAGLCCEPNGPKEMLMAAQQVLERHWGLFEYFPYDEAGEFVWHASEHGIEDQAKSLVKLHDPELAASEWGV